MRGVLPHIVGDMYKLPNYLVAIAIGSALSMAAESDSIECRLLSLNREFVVETELEAVLYAPLNVEIELVPPTESTTVLSIVESQISITDAKGNALKWSLFEGHSGNVAGFEVYTEPQGEWVEIKGNLTARISNDKVTHPGQTVKMGEKGKLNIPGCEISYEWDDNSKLKMFMREADAMMLADFIFKTPSGEEVEILSSSCMSGMGEEHRVFRFKDDVKAVSVIAKTYSDLKRVSVPVHKRIGFSGELKAE